MFDENDLKTELAQLIADIEKSFQPPPSSLDSLKEGQRLLAKMRLRRLPSAKVLRNNEYLRSVATETGEIAPGVEYWIAPSRLGEEFEKMKKLEAEGVLPPGYLENSFFKDMVGALNGYVAFPKRRAPLRTRKADGIVDFIPVHGGVTYYHKDATACVFGFDTGHFNSSHLPITDKAWIKWQCKVLYEGVVKAAAIENEYRHAQTNDARAKILQPLADLIPEEDLGTGALIRIMFGGKL
jgi:hypothetical protein